MDTGKVAEGESRGMTLTESPILAISNLRAALNGALRGKTKVVEYVIAGLLARGHLLMEDLPGLGKTTLAKALARSFGLDFHRVQFTADLLPADVTGAMVLDRDRGQPVFRPGPIFTN